VLAGIVIFGLLWVQLTLPALELGIRRAIGTAVLLACFAFIANWFTENRARQRNTKWPAGAGDIIPN